MMENQEYNPKQEYEAVQRRILDGDAETAQKFAAGEYRALKESADQYVEPVMEEFVEPQQELVVEETEPEAVAVSDEPEGEEPFDAEAHERKLYDDEMARWEAQIKAERERAEEIERQAEETRLQNEKLLKELEEARKAHDEDDDLFSIDDTDLKASKPVETEQIDTKVVGDTSVSELRAELEQFKRQQQEKELWNNTVESYSSFWDSNFGKELAPATGREETMKEFNEFYSDLSEGLNDKEAIRLMYDIRKHGMNDFYKDKLDTVGVKVPAEFEKMYDSMELYAYSNGQKIDPKLGKFVDSGKGTFPTMEDAYFILNKDNIIAKEKEEAYHAMRNKLDQKENAAVQLKPSEYQPIATAVQNAMSKDYRTELLRQATASGYNGTMNSISDPVIRQKMQELHAIMKKQ